MTAPDYFARLCNSLATQVYLRLSKRTSLETVRELLAGMPEDWRLHFYDRDYRSPSDPGSYIEVVHQGDLFLFQRTNYHWYGPWQKRRLDKMAEMVHRCRCHKDPTRPSYLNDYVYMERKAPLPPSDDGAKRMIKRTS